MLEFINANKMKTKNKKAEMEPLIKILAWIFFLLIALGIGYSFIKFFKG
tara:strand:- start:186 stop:332 length:147 start_codon:yes stop_codon:yes gene_type:complete